ncbi:hypothetical protein Tco_1099894 [Tanacetum coccineum]
MTRLVVCLRSWLFHNHKVTPSDIQHSSAYSDLRVLQIGIRAKVIENQVKIIISSVTSVVYLHFCLQQPTLSPDRDALLGAEYEEYLRRYSMGHPISIRRTSRTAIAPPSPEYIPAPEITDTYQVPDDE